MKTQPKLIRILTPPPLGPSNVLHDHNLPSTTAKALGLHLAKSIPAAAPRTSQFKLHLITMHSSRPHVAYLLVPDGNEKKQLPVMIVVQHIKTRAILWNMSLGEMASILFDYDVVSKGAEQKQHKLLKDLGNVHRLDFFDPSTLYWSGHGAIGGPQDEDKRWSCLLVQFTNRLCVVNLRRRTMNLTKGATPNDPSFEPILAHLTPESLGSPMSSNALPVSINNLVVGTDDGTLKLYDWKSNVVIQSLKVLNSKNDNIVQIISVNKYGTPESYSQSKRKLICLTKKGVAFLMEVHVMEGIVHDISGPLARFEGGSVPTSMSKQDDDHSSMEHIFVQYCGFRDLLLWTHPSKNKAKLFVWDMATIPEPDTTQKKRHEPAKPEPLLVMQFPYETTHTIFPGWLHESVPSGSMTCAAVTKEGDFQILVAPLYNSGSTLKNPFGAFTALSTNLHQVIQRDLDLPEDKDLHVKVHSVFCPPLRDSSIFYFGTNFGILLLKMVDGNLVPVPGAMHAHLSANVGSMGRAVLSVKGPEIMYGALEPPGGPLAVNPIGSMESKNDLVVYESPPPLHLPPEIYKRPVRLPPCFLPSPSRNFLCCFWKEEMRYEVLHIESMLSRVTTRSSTGISPVVATGNGIVSFAWVGDDDVFGLLYHPEQDLALKVGIDLSAPTASLGKELASAASNVSDLAKLKNLKKLKEMSSVKKAVRRTGGKLKSLEGLRDLASTTQRATMGTVKLTGKVALGTMKNTTKATVGAVKGTTKATAGAVMGTTKLAVGTVKVGVDGTRRATKLAVGGTSKVVNKATFGLVGRKQKSKKNQTSGSLADAEAEEEAGGPVAANAPLGKVAGDLDSREGVLEEKKFPWVELRTLVGVTGTDGNVNSTSTSNLGQLTLRSGNRNPPTILFGGPVLCVGSKMDEDDEGLAYFYTRKKGSSDERVADYVSSGPAFPCPDLVVWDDDGRLCAVVIQSKVSVYLSDEPQFIMLGTARLGSAADVDVQVISARFIHGALYCTTRSSVQCIFLGDLEGGVCHLDSFTLASSDVPTIPSKTIVSDYVSLTPPTIPLALNHPNVLGYQNGALVLSTVAGVQAIPLGFPLIRIGSLIAAGQLQKAVKWFDAVPEADHESLAVFLERRGVPEIALQLSGVSLETIVDVCMRHGFVDRLEEVIDLFGLNGLRAIDMGRGMSTSVFGPEDEGTSLVVCVGAYLLGHGKVELVRRLATECLAAGDQEKREAFVLASLLLSVDGSDAKRVINRAVSSADPNDWLVGSFVRDHIIDKRQS